MKGISTLNMPDNISNIQNNRQKNKGKDFGIHILLSLQMYNSNNGKGANGENSVAFAFFRILRKEKCKNESGFRIVPL